MENRNSGELLEPGARREPLFVSISAWAALILCLWVGGCAAPGEPLERKPLVPAAVTDLSAQQLGNDVILTFTMPQKNTDQRPLKQTPVIEIYRALAPTPAQQRPSPTLLVTIPAAIADQYAADKGQIRYADSLRASDFTTQPVEMIYMVRTRATPKKASENSNRVELSVYPPADAITDLNASLSREGVNLKWTPPAKTLVGLPAAIAEYHVYRAEVTAPADQTAPGSQSLMQ
jgi:hypothetical protein